MYVYIYIYIYIFIYINKLINIYIYTHICCINYIHRLDINRTRPSLKSFPVASGFGGSAISRPTSGKTSCT